MWGLTFYSHVENNCTTTSNVKICLSWWSRLKRHKSIGVFVTGSSMPISPSKSRDLANENNKILTERKWFETTVLHDYINSLRREGWAYKTSWTPSLFIEVYLPSQGSEHSFIWVLEVSILSQHVSTIFTIFENCFYSVVFCFFFILFVIV